MQKSIFDRAKSVLGKLATTITQMRFLDNWESRRLKIVGMVSILGLVGVLLLVPNTDPPSEIVERAIFRDAGTKFFQFLNKIMDTDLQMLGVIAGENISPETMFVLDGFEILNSYTRNIDDEKWYVIEYDAMMRLKDGDKANSVKGTISLVKRGKSWYGN
jgi:hypothetical protein